MISGSTAVLLPENVKLARHSPAVVWGRRRLDKVSHRVKGWGR